MKGHHLNKSKEPNTCLMSKLQSDSFSLQDVFRKSGLSGKIALAVATWFGTGLLPVAPGTFATIATVPLVLGLHQFGIVYRALGLALIMAIALWASDRHQEMLGRTDPAEVVVDEVAGFLLTMLFLPLSWVTLGLGFVFFRFFDILKLYPIKRLESLRGGLGIVIDDLVAAIYAYICVRVILFFYG
jgi:phosphatidylglycerophosphatase A